MKYIRRTIEKEIGKALGGFPAVVLTGPRRAGKTCMLRHMLPEADYRLLEDPDVVARIRSDPHGFLDELSFPVILDEIQNVPELFSYIRSRIDQRPHQFGQWLITGSQDAPLMQGVSESMAGRAAILQLLPFSIIESGKVSLLRGGYPEVIARPSHADRWFTSYLQTYLERDVRSITAVKDISTFRRFLALLAARHGQMLNKTDIAAPLGMSVPTVTRWLGVLEATEQIMIVPPFYENLGKRLIKSPKIYISDAGLACHLLGLETMADVEKSPFAGSLAEGFIASEILKSQVNVGKRRELYYFRDEQGLEVDFIMPGSAGALRLIECKFGRTVSPSMAKPMLRLAEALSKKRPVKTPATMNIVYRPSKTTAPMKTVAPGLKALSWEEFFHDIH